MFDNIYIKWATVRELVPESKTTFPVEILFGDCFNKEIKFVF